MVRIAYFGTDGCPGHYAIPIRGKFTEEDIKVIESVDCDDFYKVFDVMRFKIAEFKGWTILGIPASLDDHRPGSKNAPPSGCRTARSVPISPSTYHPAPCSVD